MTTETNKRIIFLGTPDFAVATLDALVAAGLEVVAVVTMPDKPAGRGQKLISSPVKQYAMSNAIPVLQPVKLKDPVFLETLRSYDAALQVVVAFRMLPEVVWNMPPMGTFNLHASLLPQYRGAAPINWALINGEKETGVTTFKLKHEIDTGDLIYQQKVAIGNELTAGELHDELMAVGAKLMVKTVKDVFANEVHFQPQSAINADLRHAPKIFKPDCRISWHTAGAAIHNLIRGLSPYPAAFTDTVGGNLKIFRSAFIEGKHDFAPGKCRVESEKWLVSVRDGWIELLEVQLEGKKRMAVSDFLKGNRNLAQADLPIEFR